eukprot:4559877-Pleurochrysis_carterae.AAC.7
MKSADGRETGRDRRSARGERTRALKSAGAQKAGQRRCRSQPHVYPVRGCAQAPEVVHVRK